MSDRYPQFPPETLSVTEVIKESGLLNYPATVNSQWFMDRGTAVHAATEYYDKGTLDESTVAEEIRGYLNAWIKYRADTGYTPEVIEKTLLHPVYGYCGKIDRNGLDIKTGGPAPWHRMQGAAYNELEVEHSITTKREWKTVYLQEDGTYKIQICTTRELIEAKKDFLTLLAALRIKEKYK